MFDKETLSSEPVDSTRKQQKLVGVYLGGGKLNSGENKAEVKFNGLPVAVWVLRAILKTPQVNRIVAIVPDKEVVASLTKKDKDKPIDFFQASDRFTDNTRIVLNETDLDEDVLILFSDLPFVQSVSLSRLADSESPKQLLIPSVFESQLRVIGHLHNLHFNPSREGYFHLGSAVLMRKEARDKIDIDRFGVYYAGKSFREDPKAKLRAALELGGKKAVLIAFRLWVSANLQHKNLKTVDKLIPSPSLRIYQELASRISNIPTELVFGPFGDLFLDFDYPDDARLLQRNFSRLKEFMQQHTKGE